MKRDNPLAPYFVQMRDAERRLLNGAFEQATSEGIAPRNQIRHVASLLGVAPKHVRVRAKILGGVLPGEPRHEPPDLASKVWHGGRKTPKPKLEIVKDLGAESDA